MQTSEGIEEVLVGPFLEFGVKFFIVLITCIFQCLVKMNDVLNEEMGELMEIDN